MSSLNPTGTIQQAPKKIKVHQGLHSQDYSKYFSDVKASVNYQRDNLKKKIDTYYDELLQSIHNIESDLKNKVKNIEKLTTNLKETKRSLDQILGKSATCMLNDKKMDTVIMKTSRLKTKLDEKILDFKNVLMSCSEDIFVPLQYDTNQIFDYKKKETNSLSNDRLNGTVIKFY